jgi:Putative motility protein
MDISPAGAVAMNQVKVQNEYAVSVLKKSLDISVEQGVALVKMLDQSSGVGQRVDLFA